MEGPPLPRGGGPSDEPGILHSLASIPSLSQAAHMLMRLSRRAFRTKAGQTAAIAFMLVVTRVLLPSMGLTHVWILSCWAYNA